MREDLHCLHVTHELPNFVHNDFSKEILICDCLETMIEIKRCIEKNIVRKLISRNHIVAPILAQSISVFLHQPTAMTGIAWLSEGVSDTDLSEADASIASHLTDGRCSSGQPRPSIKMSPPYIIGQLVWRRALPRAPSTPLPSFCYYSIPAFHGPPTNLVFGFCRER
ncbi:hypothetical protein CDAR_218171 [Caerostris darwini]|uniref:Uncharacterized protein n=1 Tax=Caerostris darwini TaxID=1538125 RepID=A0AAV4W858_9ARAC|nr:hypothetical protein CDAR_218171 [Caerostris darwini]